jgi:hypothetical protein
MPSFYPGGPEDVLGGNEQRQMLALRDYLMMLGRKEKPSPEVPASAPSESEDGEPAGGATGEPTQG